MQSLAHGGKYHHLLAPARVSTLAQYDAQDVAESDQPLVFFATVGTFNQEIDPYLATIDLVERLEPGVVHSGHWPVREGAAIVAWLAESREYVAALDAALHERLGAPATLRELCDHVDERLGPYASGPIVLMFAVHGHLRRLVRRGRVRVDMLAAPPRFHLIPERERPDAQLV